jgi:hypothetical protein
MTGTFTEDVVNQFLASPEVLAVEEDSIMSIPKYTVDSKPQPEKREIVLQYDHLPSLP